MTTGCSLDASSEALKPQSTPRAETPNEPDAETPNEPDAEIPNEPDTAPCSSCLFSVGLGGPGFGEGQNAPHGALLAVDSTGNLLIGGDFQGPLDLGNDSFVSTAGSSDIFLASLSEQGDIRWSKHFGDGGHQSLTGLAATPDGGVVITGMFEGSLDLGGTPMETAYLAIFLARLDSQGRHVWSRSFAGDGQAIAWAHAVTVDSTGDALLFGNLEGTVDYGGFELDNGALWPVIVKFDERGDPLWGKSFGGSVDQTPVAIATDSQNNIYIAEESKRSVIDGVTLQGDAFANTLAASFDPEGTLRWARIFRERPQEGPSDASDTFTKAMTVDPLGNMVLTGLFAGTLDVDTVQLTTENPESGASFVLKLNAAGEALWGTALENTSIDTLSVDSAGDVLLGGSLQGALQLGGTHHASAGGTDTFAARLRKLDGAPAWSQHLGDAADQRASAIAAGSAGKVILTGVFDGHLDLGCGTLSSASGKDLFLSVLRP
ncbi:Hypothetical protein CAP_6625 [Chondromyces apiculatus DSM 436]|uniref:Cell surface protein n=2 Tax=Chondromyces apiculatus TaxID=51 RepID=A0A017T1L0_9BACT|nr:Hypothetical protein CAP_6625 [Chondromyces apiculatus DSM 436]